MAATKKHKRMTAEQKRIRAEVKKDLQQKGLLPPAKKPLNRKRFVAEARDILRAETDWYQLNYYLHWALIEMMGHMGSNYTLDLEAVGAAKVIHLAKRRMDFEAEQKAQGKDEWTVGEMCDAVMDIYNA